MTRFPRSLVVSVLAAVVVLIASALPALAKSSTVSTTGNDISWPQCGRTYPAGQAFGIVGVNHGLANNLNTCLASELSWAATSTGNALPLGFPKTALYVNTADPGSVVPVVADWPTDNCDPNQASKTSCSPSADPYGSCAVGSNGAGLNDPACAWQYGWNRAIADMLWLVATPTPTGVSHLPADYWWWLDVETGNTWESGVSGLANNVADLRGMVAAFRNTVETTPSGILLGGKAVGIYSTSYQWGQITSSAADGYGDLVGLPDWIPGARTLSGAQANCSLTGFTAARPTITQWFGKPYDGDFACP